MATKGNGRQVDYDRWTQLELLRLYSAYKRTKPRRTAHEFYLALAKQVRRTPGAVMWVVESRWRMLPKLLHSGGKKQ